MLNSTPIKTGDVFFNILEVNDLPNNSPMVITVTAVSICNTSFMCKELSGGQPTAVLHRDYILNEVDA
jgi:hypothetical protein